MKRVIFGATIVAMFLGTAAFAGNKKTATKNNGNATTTAVAQDNSANILQAGKHGKVHKKRRAKHSRHAAKKAQKASAAPATK